MKENNRIKIGLIGHSFCSLNMGVGVLTAGEMHCIEEAAKRLGIDCEVTCFETLIHDPYSLNGYLDRVTLKEYNLKNIWETKKKFSEMDVIIDVAGGDSFSDIYGAKLFIVQMFIRIAILLSKRKYILAPQTYGPFDRGWARSFANYYVKKASAVFARDNISVTCLSEKNQKKVQNVTDLGFSMSYTPSDKREKFTVGFNVSGLLYQSDKLVGIGLDYPGLCDEIIALLKEKDVNVVLVPHVVGKTDEGIDNDTGVCKRVAVKHGIELAPAFNDPVEAKNFISQCDLFIGSRMHATIGAVSSGVPTVPLAYSRKFVGVFGAVEYPYTVDLNSASKEEILKSIEDGLANHKAMEGAIEQSMSIAKEKTERYIKALAEVFSQI